MDIQNKVYKLVSQIPKGKVLTYGQVSRMLRINSSRLVGQILHKNPDPQKIPCHRVVFADGSLSASYAFGGEEKQRQLLENEGVRFSHNKVQLYQHNVTGLALSEAKSDLAKSKG